VKIALIRRRYVESGGAERYVAQLVTALSGAGHAVHLFANRWAAVPAGVQVHRVPVPPGPAFLGILGFAWAAHRMTRRESFDLVLSFDRTIRPDVYRAGDGCHQAWLDRRQAVEGGVLRCLDRLNPLHRSLIGLEGHLFGGGSRRIIVNSRMVQEEILRYYGTVPALVRVVYTGVDLARFHPDRSGETRAALRGGMGLGREEPVVLFAGSGFERKGLAFLLRAARRIEAGRGLKIWVLGKGNADRYRGMAKRLGILDWVHFAGVVTDPEDWMRAADLFVLPTIYDPFSNACLEAMASGLPVITTGGNGVAEIMQERRTGAVVGDPRDVTRLAECMQEFLEPAGREERAAAARECAQAFSAEKHTEQLLAACEEVLREAGA
jgi:UDP-glucose:(heptosyl)LPS alpha-1,3-glucosyltransferase